jgi:formylglycine-generating enzyme required for sulfatase activity
VTISKAFYLGRFEVTQKQYLAVMGTNPSDYIGDLQRPVETVSWFDAQAFCAQMSAKTGYTVRLPTEAEWEYACRAGTTTRFNTGDSDSAMDYAGWHFYNSNFTTHAVGGKTANAWGLYDMHGNVFEWCQDWYGLGYTPGPVTDPENRTPTTPFRVFRGGSFAYIHQNCRSASRYGEACEPDGRVALLGFRVVCVPKTP